MAHKIFVHVPDLERYTWPGGYPILYVADIDTRNQATLCPACATEEKRKASLENEHHTFTPFVHYEGPDEICEGCNEPTESAYGDPDATAEDA